MAAVALLLMVAAVGTSLPTPVPALALWLEGGSQGAILHAGLDWPADMGCPERVLLRARGQEWACSLSFAWARDAGGQTWHFQGRLMAPLARGEDVTAWVIYRVGGRRHEYAAGRLRVGGFGK
jgi:hypothetical protein